MKLRTLFFCTILLTQPARAGDELSRADDIRRDTTLTLEETTRAALTNNPAIKASRARWEMMKARIPQAGAWDDAMAGVDFERSGTTQFGTYRDAEWMLSQKIPLAGKNRSRARAASAEALAALEEFRRQQLDVVANIRTAYFRLIEAGAQIEVNRRNESLLSQLLEISRAKYEVGTQTQSSVLTAETDLIRLREDRRDLERDLSNAHSQLNVLMNRPARAPLGSARDVSVRHASFEPQRLESLALENRPELQRADRRIAAEQQRLQAAKRDWIPEPQVRVEARSFKGNSQAFQEYDTGVFFNVPLGNWKKYSAQESEARSSVEMATQELEAARAETSGLVRDALKKVETFHHHVALFRDQLLPLATQSVEASRAGYETDKSSFLELIGAQRTLRDSEAAYHRHLADYRIALAELEAVVGVDLHIFPSVGLTTAAEASK
ncbi:MAG TPA: TolC family protein [Chthoniobacterales bacterium]|nr:TolC family protein [Chthoniobacterales bacterium]